MTINNKYKKQLNKFSETENEENNSLQFKEHRDFFDALFEMRRNITANIAEAKTSPKAYGELISSIEVLIDWTSNYITDIETIDKMVHNAVKEKNKLKSIRGLKRVFRRLNVNYEKNELIPQKIVVKTDQNEWEKIQRQADKNIVKACLDFIK